MSVRTTTPDERLRIMKSYLIFVVFLSVVCFGQVTELRGEGVSKLGVSANGRFLVRKDGTAFFPVADTAWKLAWELKRSEVERYLERRQVQKFNTIAIIAFPSCDTQDATKANAYGDHAFKINSKGRYNPLQPMVTPGNKVDGAVEYDYWDHLEYIIDTSAAKGMYVILLPAWGSRVAGDWGDGRTWPSTILNSTNAYKYGSWIGQRFGSKKNIIWMIGGDRSAVYGKRDFRGVFRAIAEGVADGVNGVNQQDGKADYSTTLMSYHPRKWKPNSSEWFHKDMWLDFNSIQDHPGDQITATEKDYGLEPTKPTWLFEGRYEYAVKNGIYKDWQMRFQSYQTVFAGGFGITYGSMNIYHFGNKANIQDEPVASGKISKWEKALDEAGAMDMQHLFNLMTSWSNEQYLDRIPDQSLLDGDQGAMEGGEGFRSSRLQATRGRKGDYAMVYTANGRDIYLKMNRLAAPRMNAFWFNPRNGKWRVKDSDLANGKPFAENIPSGPGAPMRTFDPPGKVGDGNDWVLVLKVPSNI